MAGNSAKAPSREMTPEERARFQKNLRESGGGFSGIFKAFSKTVDYDPAEEGTIEANRRKLANHKKLKAGSGTKLPGTQQRNRTPPSTILNTNDTLG